MNTSPNIFDLVQKGFRVTVGAAATLVETIKDPQKRDVTITEFRTELENRTAEWSEKGEMTEAEARKFLENVFQKDSSKAAGDREVSTSAVEVKDAELEKEIQVLTEQITMLKTELETLRKESSAE
ncbi:hypothetical protein Lepto7376_2168 [[Leptolyngbya] sp. PCC 7376]|uniref:hypothetical protein n=1 Tax=[Leptolyngbya] sp. PCC 7376 TaxID=111781 RepID=UPI00029F2698|nr:hypothetical protein [[Leptolyngbya] sp. PCC 7376]AFY38463.1 hypothetical protein Lepto7376_2168 [[Leptolyngbya] sp. PCC 7376]